MARSSPANCQYVVSKINEWLGTSYTVASGTGQRPANKNYLAKWIDKANGGSTNYASQVTNGGLIVNCGTVYDQVRSKVLQTFTFYVNASSSYGSPGILGSVTLNANTKTFIFDSWFYDAGNGPANITSNAPTCVGGYIGFRSKNEMSSPEASDSLKAWLTKVGWTVNKNINVTVEFRGTSVVYGGGGYVQQKFAVNVNNTDGIKITVPSNASGWGAASSPPPYTVRGNISDA